jgi:DNA modification methylase
MTVQIINGDCIESMRGMADQSAHCCITSPPYFGLRDYGVDGQIGLEQSPAEFVAKLVEVFREVRRVLRDDGTLWLNLGDSYANDGKWGGSSGGKHASPLHGNTSIGRTKVQTGLKPKDLIGIPWRVAFALQADGWYLRQDIIWAKPNPMPESVRDRCTKAHEYLFLLSKSERYYFDGEAIKEPAIYGGPNNGVGFGHGTDRDARGRGRIYQPPQGGPVPGSPPQSRTRHKGNRKTFRGGGVYTNGQAFNNSEPAPADSIGNAPSETGTRNRRSVWTVATRPFKGAHFATFPPALIEPCVLAGCPVGGAVLDPFGGAGTTGVVAQRHGRNAVLCELNPEYAAMAEARIRADRPQPDLFGSAA